MGACLAGAGPLLLSPSVGMLLLSCHKKRGSTMAGFVQIIEFTTSRYDQIRALVDERGSGPGLAVRGVVAEDRDRPGTYINIVEFESYESAMENSSSPETQEFAAKMAELCDGPARFYNLDVLERFET